MHSNSTVTQSSIAPKGLRGDSLCRCNLKILEQLGQGIGSISQDIYTHTLDQQTSSIGMHVRHVIEFYQEFFKTIKGTADQTLCYDNRQRNMLFETSKDTALEELENLQSDFTSSTLDDRKLNLSITIHQDSNLEVIGTTLHRELYHLFDHATHHMAIIKMIAAKQNVSFDENFGVACSTQVHHNAQK